MKTIEQHVHGTIVTQVDRVALLLLDWQPSAVTAESLYLRYALTRQGVETPVFPAFVLDDWGSEIRGLELYEWVRDFGDQFPRAELFGFDLDGREAQCFLRELELHVRLPCYVYRQKGAALGDGLLVEALALPDETIAPSSSPTAAVRIRPPATIKGPLRSAKVSWWSVDPKTLSFDALFT